MAFKRKKKRKIKTRSIKSIANFIGLAHLKNKKNVDSKFSQSLD